jgi:hypothetical protein
MGSWRFFRRVPQPQRRRRRVWRELGASRRIPWWLMSAVLLAVAIFALSLLQPG